MDARQIIQHELGEAAEVLQNFMRNTTSMKAVEAAAHRLADVVRLQGKIIACGNGGSHCDAMHFAEEMTGKYRDERNALPALCITNPAHISCVGNDYGYSFVFSRYIEALGKQGDALLAISTSGNSPNIVQAARAARSRNMTVVALTGMDGGKLATLADIAVCVPHRGFADRIQEVHIKVIHILIMLIEKLIEK